MEDCVFCKIIKREIPSVIVYETDNVICFEDNNPEALVHVLVVPKKHIVSFDELNGADIDLMKDITLAIHEVARIKNIKETGYRVTTNIGNNGGQVIKHLHFHVLGGEKLITRLKQ